MRKKTYAALAAAVLAAGALAGCSSQNTEKGKGTAAGEGTEETGETAVPSSEAQEGQAEGAGISDADIVIAGGDAAGMAAAIQAVAEGMDPSKILVLEKGGAEKSALSGESFNAADTDEQAEAGIEDSVDAFITDTMAAGGGKNSQEMVEHMAESGREALVWLRDQGVELSGVTQAEGSSVARSYQAADGGNLGEEIEAKLQEKFDSLNVNVAENTELAQVLYGADGEVTGVKVKGDDGEQEITCRALLVTDVDYIDLLEDLAVSYVTDESGANKGILVDSCANAVTADGGEIPGLYGAGAVIDAALHGDKALAGNELTGTIAFGMTAGTETAIYAQDNAPEA